MKLFIGAKRKVFMTSRGVTRTKFGWVVNKLHNVKLYGFKLFRVYFLIIKTLE